MSARAAKLVRRTLRWAAISVAVFGLLHPSPVAAETFQWHSAINDDRKETVATVGNARSLTLDTTRPGGVWVSDFVPGQTYTLRVQGTYRYGNSTKKIADAECTTDVGGSLTSGTFVAKRFLDRDYYDVMVKVGNELASFDWRPESPYTGADASKGEPQCSSTHVYTASYAPSTTSLSFVVDDPVVADNQGLLTITVARGAFSTLRRYANQNYQCPKWTDEPVSSAPTGVVGEIQTADVMVDSRRNPYQVPYPYATDSGPANATNPYYPHIFAPEDETGHWGIYTCNWALPDSTYRIVVDDLFTYDETVQADMGPEYAQADAECTTGTEPGDTAWKRDRYIKKTTSGLTYDYMDLYINYKAVEWTPLVDENGDGCADDHHHTYFIDWRPDYMGPIHFKIYDIAYRELTNRGELCMDVEKIS